ncbi:Mur ligase domain-containing protein, partial [Haemophilus parainfluenzae]|uniref:Mur ligase domain-containing protein n=1 Tax=Haemophilus parainfluenzae TaxID=729 RepID=UPI001CED9F51
MGVGGIGMSALAYILTRQNLPVSGSDLRLTHITRRLQEAGVHIFWKQEAANLNFFQASASQPHRAQSLPNVSGPSLHPLSS